MDARKNRWRSPITVLAAIAAFSINWIIFRSSWPPRRHDLILLAAMTMPSVAYDLYRLVGLWLGRDDQGQGELLLTSDLVQDQTKDV